MKFETSTNQNIAGLQVINKNEVLNLYLFYICRSLYNTFVKDLSQYDILNLQRIREIKIPVPSLAEQQCIVQEIETYEAAITAAKAVMATCAEKKKMILDKWL